MVATLPVVTSRNGAILLKEKVVLRRFVPLFKSKEALPSSPPTVPPISLALMASHDQVQQTTAEGWDGTTMILCFSRYLLRHKQVDS